MKTRNEMIQWCIDVEFDFVKGTYIGERGFICMGWDVKYSKKYSSHVICERTNNTNFIRESDVYGIKLPDTSVTSTTTEDVVRKPKHYVVLGDVETIHIIAASMTVEGFQGYCMGNIIKYRLRAGNKDDINQDINKADFYPELFDMHKHLCRGYVGGDK